jgi:hypothetical protein
MFYNTFYENGTVLQFFTFGFFIAKKEIPDTNGVGRKFGGYLN